MNKAHCSSLFFCGSVWWVKASVLEQVRRAALGERMNKAQLLICPRSPVRIPAVHIGLLQLAVYNISTRRIMCEICATLPYNGWMAFGDSKRANGNRTFDYPQRRKWSRINSSSLGHISALFGPPPPQKCNISDNQGGRGGGRPDTSSPWPPAPPPQPSKPVRIQARMPNSSFSTAP